ncbi:MAG TPA: DUF2631 domain-containing protein [Micromonosporaceae bacterium]|nr:DUF2631 domain-containing protein [Micromonosporaceae bacterium]
MAGSEPVTSPDQHKPGNRRAARVGAVITIVVIVLMGLFGNHEGRVEEVFSYLVAAALAAILVGDVALRRIGLRK